MTRTIDAAMVASTLGLATVTLGAAGQRSRMKAGLAEGRCNSTLSVSALVMAPEASTMGEDVVTADSLPSKGPFRSFYLLAGPPSRVGKPTSKSLTWYV
jgi:hypothetical protein